MATGSSLTATAAVPAGKAGAAAVVEAIAAAIGDHGVISIGPARGVATETNPAVDNRYDGTSVPSYNGARFGLRRPAEPEYGGASLSALPARQLTHSSRPWCRAGNRPDHDRGGGARPERGPAGRALRGCRREAARPAAQGH